MKPPDQHILVKDLEGIAERPATKIELAAQLPSRPRSLLGGRITCCPQRTLAWPWEGDPQLIGEFHVITDAAARRGEVRPGRDSPSSVGAARKRTPLTSSGGSLAAPPEEGFQ